MHYTKIIKSLSVIIMVIIAGCVSGPEKKPEPVFFPEPPFPARIQYLRSYTTAADIEQKKSVFEVFITGQQDRIAYLDKPYGVAIHDGKIYVCDTNATVFVLDLKKKSFLPLEAATRGLGKVVQPLNISIDKEGNKYVADPIGRKVVLYDKNDVYIKSYTIPDQWKPLDAVAYEDRLYVADGFGGHIRVFNKETGELVQSIGNEPDPKYGRLILPTNITFDNEGYLYVADAGKFQIVKLDRDGHIRGVIGELGDRVGSFTRPRGVAIDKQNRLYAVDAAFNNVQIFNKDGRLLFFFGQFGIKRGSLFLPAKIAIDYDNISYFQEYVDPHFEIEGIMIVTSQFGDYMVNVYALGKEKGKTYPTEEDVIKELKDKEEKFKKEHPEQGNKPEEIKGETVKSSEDASSQPGK